MSEAVEYILKRHYDFVYNNLEKPEIIIEKYFGVKDLYYETAIINEEIIYNTFLSVRNKERFSIFHYDDFIDFINTYCGVDPIDLMVYLNEKDFQVFVVNFIKILNVALKYWIVSKGTGFRKNTKIIINYIEGKGEITIDYIPDLKI